MKKLPAVWLVVLFMMMLLWTGKQRAVADDPHSVEFEVAPVFQLVDVLEKEISTSFAGSFCLTQKLPINEKLEVKFVTTDGERPELFVQTQIAATALQGQGKNVLGA